MHKKFGYSVQEALEIFPWGRTVFYREIKAGRLRAHKLGNSTVIFPEDLDAYRQSLLLLKTEEKNDGR